ncbi:MAG: ABC transporter permease [Hyphomonas sp.]|uniref:ABC transporter permease n=1 Tax=unclassified Hyphomonas TaxID=2630699 RepID=UPI000DEDAC38|nr:MULTISPECIES: ABC transporter permease [unclassified Hyphomonas]AXE64976.1 hypothetical protein BBF93_12625 [Hyphomonas sp. CACIAM 19H1]MBA4226174.1 ABC transporter permease [Hyphomonas sp.]
MSAFFSAFTREVAFLASSFWDRAMVTWIPLALMGVLALQLSSGVMRDLPIVVVDQDRTQVSRELTAGLEAAPGLTIAARNPDIAAAEQFIRSKKAYAIVLIPDGTGRAVQRGGTAPVTVLYNASYSTASGAAVRDINTVIQNHSARLAAEHTAALAAAGSVRPAPVSVQSTILFNPQGSYELQLISLLHPALLHLAFMVAVTSALGRELRDGTIGVWLSGSGAVALAIAGKVAPYVLVFMVWGLAATAYLSGLRGWPVYGSVLTILAAYFLMYLAYAGMALLIVGISRSMMQSLSVTGLYAGASFAFAGAIFPIEAASDFARFWSAILPYTWFARVVAEQWSMDSPFAVSLAHLGCMALFLIPGVAIGLPRYVGAAAEPSVWGRR